MDAQQFDPLLGNSALQAVPNGISDVYYTFTYTYGNGDFYSGYGYADATFGYAPGQVFFPYYDETYYEGYNTGFYQITSTYDYGIDYGAQNQVYVTDYFDADTASYASYLYDYSFTVNYGYGAAGLGSEIGYAYNFSLTNSDPLFGYAYYEADLYTV